ncbi:MAG: regulatory iron-sulfur-containing complex subunit RicT [Mariniblastus sp.]
MPKYIVRYGLMRSIGAMTSRNDIEYRRSMEVIVRSDRGLEIGQVLCEASDDALSHLDQAPSGQIVREVSTEDLGAIDDIDGSRQSKLAACQKHIETLGLDMKLVDIEQLFGGERLVVFYLAEERVDFRELVKLLASDFQTRIEMKQIGVRDEAKLLADYGDCGKPVCCNNHLVTMPPVSMKMAKLQKATLDPTKISGRCGRLKCCLRYEFDTYEEIQKQLPRIGAQIVTRDGKAKVLNHRIITEQILIETEDHRRMVIDASEVLTVIKKSNSNSNSREPSKSAKQTGDGAPNTKRRPRSESEDSTKPNKPRPQKSKRPAKKENNPNKDVSATGPKKKPANKGNSSPESVSPKGSKSENNAQSDANKPAPVKKTGGRRRGKRRGGGGGRSGQGEKK